MSYSSRHKPREQDPPPAFSRLDALTSHVDKSVQIKNRVVGAIVISPTNAASQEPVVGSAQCVVVASARAPRDAAPYSIVSSTSALIIRILSSTGALGRSYISRAYFRKLHHALRMRRSTSMDRSAV